MIPLSFVRWFACFVFRHPPSTSFWTESVENAAERAANLQTMKGRTMTVNCVCGKKMVNPIWRPGVRR